MEGEVYQNTIPWQSADEGRDLDRFPEATHMITQSLVVQGEPATNYIYFRISPDQFEMHGMVTYSDQDEENFSQTYSDPRTEIRFPMRYGDSLEDTYSHRTIVAGRDVGTTTGNWIFTYDGYGTLILGDRTWNNVIRTRSVQEDATQKTTTYTWSRTTYNSRILQIVKVESFVNNSIEAVYNPSVPTAAGEKQHAENLGIRCWPNPASGHMHVGYQATRSGSACIRVEDALGRIVYQQTLAAVPGSNRHQLEMNQPGVYTIYIHTSEGQAFQKVIIH